MMRKSSLNVLALLGSIGVLIAVTIQLVNPDANQKTSVNTTTEFKAPPNKYEPYDHFAFARAYPDAVMDADVFQNAIVAAKDQHEGNLDKMDEGFDAPWAIEGPLNIPGRLNRVISDPTNSDIIYVAACKGGIFKTIDGGESWNPIFDDQPFLSTSEIVIDPNDNNTIYVGTGDVNISAHFALGNGVYKSTDGGTTWAHLGLGAQRIVSKIVIDPNDSNIIYVGTMGNPLAASPERGLYKTIDGGANWEQILFVDEDAGIIDMVMHPENPSIIYAAAWNRIRNAMESVVSDDDSKIFKTTDGGATWTVLTEGLPGNDLVRIGLTISPALPNDIWAVYVDNSQSLEGVYHSEDEGETWTAVSAQSSYPANLLGGFGWYFGKVAVNPYNSDDIFVLGVDLARTQNNGASWEYGDDFIVHADKHSLHFVDENTMLLATDGGLYKTEDNGNNWTPISNIPNTQLYRVEVNPHISGEYTAGAQDNGTSRGSVDEIENWERIFGGDGFQARYHPTDPDILYAETQNGSIWVSTDGGNIFDWANDGLNDADRRNWDMPYIVSQHDPDVLYTGTFRVYRSNNGVIPFWEPISEDVTDGIDDRYHTITAIAESPIDANVLYVGTSDANIYRSVDYGATWENVSDGLPEHYVTSVHASPLQSTLVYATVSGYKGNSYIPHVQRSKDSGSSWEDITGDLPQVGVNDILILPEDTTESTFFVATDAGVYATLNGGINWQRVGGDMPFIHVFDIAYDAPNRKLVAGTFSRSVQSFDLTEILDYDMITGIPTDFVQQLELEVSPNPTTDFVQIRLPETSNQISNEVEFTLTSIDGRLLKKFTENSTSSAMRLDMSHLPCGLYYLTTIVNSVQYQAKIIRK